VATSARAATKWCGPPLYTALDGYIRHLDVVVPPDAVAHIIPELGDAALKMMQRNMDADLLPVDKCL
jgi:hypothetical protein